MRIGVLTFYNVANFGANLQALSTYRFLENAGHTPIFINYNSSKEASLHQTRMEDLQYRTHIEFVEKYIKNQTEECLSIEDVVNAIEHYSIEGVVIGSDAVLQHHPVLGNIKLAKRKLFYIHHFLENRMFPNPFWGVGYSQRIPAVMFSVSSQNSEYMFTMPWTKWKMKKALKSLKYVSVRDDWTKQMVLHISGLNADVTPDPVFAYNLNAPDTVVPKEFLLKKFAIPEKYVLVSLKKQSLTTDVLNKMKELFATEGVSCVALTMPNGIRFKHNFDYEITPPLLPNEWFSLIKNAYGYVGSNMHPIVVSLHNAVPCVSIDNWGRTNFFNKKIDDGSSKVEHIMNEFGVKNNHFMIKKQFCPVTAEEIFDCIKTFPVQDVKEHAAVVLDRYKSAMGNALKALEHSV